MKILIASGGTGGHIFPALKTAERLKRDGHDVVWIGVFGSVRQKITDSGFKVVDLEAKGLLGGLTNVFRFVGSMATAMRIASRHVRSERPDVVAGFGGYSAFPTMFVAARQGIPTIFHEQNVIPGKANRVLVPWVRRIAVSFSETKKYFPPAKTVWTGCPCNDQTPAASRESLLPQFHLRADRPTLLVLGGSQGSQRINEVVFEMTAQWDPADAVQLIHMTGLKDFPVYQKKYAGSKVPVHVCAFIQNIQEAYAVADVAVSRAGAASVSELAAFAIPSVLVPYPFAHSHQTANARVLTSAGVADLIEQKDLTAAALTEAVRKILRGRLSREEIRRRLKDVFIQDPTRRLAEEIVKTGRKDF